MPRDGSVRFEGVRQISVVTRSYNNNLIRRQDPSTAGAAKWSSGHIAGLLSVAVLDW